MLRRLGVREGVIAPDDDPVPADDGLLSADEFGLGTGWFDDTTFGAFDTWDVDSSGLIDDDEFYDGVANLAV